MKRYIKSASDITNGWWTQYYNSVSAEEGLRECGYSPEEIEDGINWFQSVADDYGYKFRGFLEAKDEYVSALDDLIDISWFTDEIDRIIIGQVVGDRVYPVTKEDVEAHIEAYNEAQL